MADNKKKDDWESVDDWEDSSVPPSILEAINRGAARGLSLGFSDEIAGAISSPKGALKKAAAYFLKNEPSDDDVTKYLSARDRYRGRDKEVEQEFPVTYGVPSFAGSIATSFLPGVGIGRAAPLSIAGLAQAAKYGGLIGAGESSESSLKGIGLDIGAGAAGGGVGELAGGLLGEAVKGLANTGAANRVKQALLDLSRRRAVKHAGAMLKDERGLRYQNRLNDLGDFLLDEKIVTPFSTTEKVANRASRKLEEEGARLGDIERRLDETLGSSPTHVWEKGIRPKDISELIESEVIGPITGDPALGDMANQLLPISDRFKSLGDRTISFSHAGKMKRNFDKLVDYERENPVKKEQIKKIREILNDEIERASNELSKTPYSKGVNYPQFILSKKRYGLSSKAKEMAEDFSLNRKDANRWLSPSDYAGLIGGGLIGSNTDDGNFLSGGLLGLGANRFSRAYGNALSAVGARKLSDRLGAWQNLGPKRSQTSPLLGAKYLSNGPNNEDEVANRSPLSSDDQAGLLQNMSKTGEAIKDWEEVEYPQISMPATDMDRLGIDKEFFDFVGRKERLRANKFLKENKIDDFVNEFKDDMNEGEADLHGRAAFLSRLGEILGAYELDAEEYRDLFEDWKRKKNGR